MSLLEQTEIARRLGMSMKTLHKILRLANYEYPSNYKLINNKRCYDWDKIIELIQHGKNWPPAKNVQGVTFKDARPLAAMSKETR